MSGARILITGATGYVGFQVVLTALEIGHQVLAVIRSPSDSERLLRTPKLQQPQSHAERLKFVYIPDFCVKGAFCDVLKSVTYVIHLASPVPGDNIRNYNRDLIEPAVTATREILEAAHASPSVRRIVFTSSACAIVPWETLGYGDDKATVWNPGSRIPVAQPPYRNQSQAYNASKTMALKEIEEYVKREKPHFDVIHIFPGWVIGRDDRATDVEGTVAWTNAAAFGHVFGHEETAPRSPICGHVRDVAQAHVRALDLSVPGNRSFGACLQIEWDDAKAIVAKHFPDAVREGIFPCTGSQPSSNMLWDNGDVEQVLGVKFVTFEEQIISIAEHYLEELSKPGAQRATIAWDAARK